MCIEGVLQRVRKCPEMSGLKKGVFARPPERFQSVSPKLVRLPLHHPLDIIDPAEVLRLKK
jgi:hypothetical protein